MLIGEVSRRTGISARMLRHYDTIGLVRPGGRTNAGYRQYSEEDLLRLFHVEGLRSLGLSLDDIAHALADVSFSPMKLVERLITRAQDRLARETELLRRLGQVQASQPTAWSDVVRTIAMLHRLSDRDPATRQHVALALTDQREGDATLLVEAMLDEPVTNVAGALHWALARLGDSSVPALQEALNSSNAERRHRASEALVKIGSPTAITALAGAFPHADPVVSARAVLARGSLAEADAIPALVTLIVDGRDDVEAADVLASLADQHDRADDISGVIAGALVDVPAGARRRLVAALADIPGGRSRALLRSLVNDSDPGVAATATFLVRQRGATTEDTEKAQVGRPDPT